MAQTMTTEFDFSTLLNQAISEPGFLSKAFAAFHGYSLGNQLLAMMQCHERGIQPGPIATFLSWKDKSRYVRKGEKAIVLCMPVTCKGKRDDADPDAPAAVFTRFVYKPRWFVLSQTEGADVAVATVGDWDGVRAAKALDVAEEPFGLMDGNCHGYAVGRRIAVSPVAESPIRVRLHELAHVVLGHTSEGETMTDGVATPRSLREVEAEAVAYLCAEVLGLPGAAESRGYIQYWNARRGAEPIPERSAQKIFKAADAILRAGRAESVDVAAEAA